jgi:hypothetical protein
VASIYLIRGGIERGSIFPDSKLAVFGSEDLFETPDLVARPAGGKSHLATFSAETFDLKPGDYVVHAEHGVGRFLGLRSIDQGEAKGDYMLLEYAGGSSSTYRSHTWIWCSASAGRVSRRSSTAWAVPPGPVPKRASKLGCATWPRSS